MRTLRRVGIGLLCFLSVITGLVTVLTIWVESTIYNEDAVSAAVDQAMRDPAVTDALAESVATQVDEAIDIEARTQKILPDALDRYGAILAAGIHRQVRDTTANALDSPKTRQLIDRSVTLSHRQLVKVLQHEPGDRVAGLSLDGSTVTFNTLPLVVRGLASVQQVGLLDDVDLPTLSEDQTPDEQRQALSESLDRPLAEGFGQVQVYDSASVEKAGTTLSNVQRLLRWLHGVRVVAPIFWIISLVSLVLLTQRRVRTAAIVATLTAAVWLVTSFGVSRVIDVAKNAVDGPGASAAIGDIANQLTSGLSTALNLGGMAFGLLAAGLWWRLRRRPADSSPPPTGAESSAADTPPKNAPPTEDAPPTDQPASAAATAPPV